MFLKITVTDPHNVVIFSFIPKPSTVTTFNVIYGSRSFHKGVNRNKDFKMECQCHNKTKKVCYCCSILLLISVFAGHPVQCGGPSMCFKLGAQCISQLGYELGPNIFHPVQNEAQRGCQIITCFLIKWHGSLICLFSSCYCRYSFCTMCLCFS